MCVPSGYPFYLRMASMITLVSLQMNDVFHFSIMTWGRMPVFDISITERQKSCTRRIVFYDQWYFWIAVVDSRTFKLIFGCLERCLDVVQRGTDLLYTNG